MSFRAGPVEDFGRKSYSSYEISRRLTPSDDPKTVAAESAFSIESFRSGYATKPESYIKLFTSTSGKTLLIEEEIPNDCSPCTNWILVRGVEGELTYDFLNLPYGPTDPADPVFGDRPTITKVSEHEIGFRYSDGTKRTMAVKDLVKKEKRPTFPG